LHREEGAWAFEVAPCDRTAMKYWKKLVDWLAQKRYN
jgi:hypothetical protein